MPRAEVDLRVAHSGLEAMKLQEAEEKQCVPQQAEGHIGLPYHPHGADQLTSGARQQPAAPCTCNSCIQVSAG